MTAKPAPADHEIHELIRNRWSPRAIDADRPVPRDLLMRMLEAARWAPSCYNDQPWRYLVWDRFEDAQAWEQAASNMGDWNQQWARRAPVLIMSLADSLFLRNDKPNRHGQHDTGAASLNLFLQGSSFGLVIHEMGGFDHIAAHAKFGIPERFTAMAMIAVGWPGDPAQLPEDMREEEGAPRQRRPIAEFAFHGQFGTPLKA